MHKCLSGISSISQCSSLSGTIWKSSSSSSSPASRVTYVFRVHLEDGHWKATMWCCFGGVLLGDGVTSAGMTSSSSSEKLKVKHLCTSLWCDSATGAAWCNWTWVKGHILYTGNMMNLGGSSK